MANHEHLKILSVDKLVKFIEEYHIHLFDHRLPLCMKIAVIKDWLNAEVGQ